MYYKKSNELSYHDCYRDHSMRKQNPSYDEFRQNINDMSEKEYNHWCHMVKKTGTQKLNSGYHAGTRWAYERGLRLSRHSEAAVCGHHLWKFPKLYDAACQECNRMLIHDHATLWVKNGKPEVLVYQPYMSINDALDQAHEYARELFLDVMVGDMDDHFYNLRSKTVTPIRFTRKEVIPFKRSEWLEKMKDTSS